MSRKFLITIVLILFLLPFVSWYYLRSGLQWRQKAQETMSGTLPFPAIDIVDRAGRNFSSAGLKDHVSIVSFVPCAGDNRISAFLDEIYGQFKETDKAYFILLDTCIIQPEASTGTDNKKWVVIPCPDSILFCQSLKESWSPGKPFALVDRNGIIRSYYSITTKEDKQILVEHMALLLPRERQEKVELKRGDKK
jgi:hypothetical protein